MVTKILVRDSYPPTERNESMDPINPIAQSWYTDGHDDPEIFWERAAEDLPWFKKWDKVYERHYPSFKWFVGGETNLGYNCLDRHVNQGRSGHAAIVYANERGERQVYTYAQLLYKVQQVAAALRGMGVQKGDRITIYMPVIPEAVMLMLAAVRIGAIHSVVFAGFGAGALNDRVKSSGSKLIFTTDVTYRKGRDIDLKDIVDSSLKECPKLEHVVVLNRNRKTDPNSPKMDITWAEFLDANEGFSGDHVSMESNEPAYILATSGTTAKPKLPVHTHGGYQVGIHAMGKWSFGINPEDVWWATSDIGWVVGHSYIVYGPLLFGCTTILYEGSIDHPYPKAMWDIVEEFGVTGMFTSPTAVRLLMRYGPEAMPDNDVSTLTRIFCAGEPLNAPAWEWLQKDVLKNRIPVIDHYWQTETGAPLIGNPYGISLLPIKPGSAGLPMPGIDIAVMNLEGETLPPGQKGILVVKHPWPSLTPSLWADPERYGADYWEKIPGYYFTGDSAHIDEDGYVWFAGRADEVIKIAAHRLGTIEVETAILKHSAVAEAGVTGRPDDLRGEIISAFVVLKNQYSPSNKLRQELLDTVRRELGPVAVMGELNFVNSLPKTRSGKIMRRVFKAVVLGEDPGDITTIEDEGSVEEARLAWKNMTEEIKQST